ncbi:DUF2577 family protein [Brevibacillus dissolubilis]|uniref:DUF2577 family protein n=1 Tax=Brevibacillus dissolubilis TaxID=1844116 RepID=UPI0011177726|nr:DUF2577 family protein [Brevibacillus dissolubilis]
MGNAGTMDDVVAMWAKLFKERENPVILSIQLGTVTNAFPNIEIKIDGLVLDKDDMVFAEHLLPDHKRKAESKGKLSFSQINAGSTAVGGSPGHSHGIESLQVSTDYTTEEEEITYLDPLKVGDTVLVQPFADGQLYYISNRVVKWSDTAK